MVLFNSFLKYSGRFLAPFITPIQSASSLQETVFVIP